MRLVPSDRRAPLARAATLSGVSIDAEGETGSVRSGSGSLGIVDVPSFPEAPAVGMPMSTLTDALDRLAAQHDRLGTPLRRLLRPGLEPRAVAELLSAADLPVIPELIELYSWHDSLDMSHGGPDLFGDMAVVPLDRAIELTELWREISVPPADMRDVVTWLDSWVAIGGTEHAELVLDASTQPATVLCVKRHGEFTNLTLARSLPQFVEQSRDLLEADHFQWDETSMMLALSPGFGEAEQMGLAGTLPEWFVAGALPDSIPMTLLGDPTRPMDPTSQPRSIHRCRPRRRLRLGQEVKGASWYPRAPIGYLEAFCGPSFKGEPLNACFILTGAEDRPVPGTTVQIIARGAINADAEVTTDARGMARFPHVSAGSGTVSLRATAEIDGARVHSSEMTSFLEVRPGPTRHDWRRVWLEPEQGTPRVQVHGEPWDAVPEDTELRFRILPGHSIWRRVGLRPPENLTEIDLREVWPGPCPIWLDAPSDQLPLWIEASGGRMAGLLVDVDPALERDGASFSSFVLTLWAERRCYVFGVRDGADFSDGVVEPRQVCSLGYGEFIEAG